MTLVKYRHPQYKFDSLFDEFFGNNFLKPLANKLEVGNSIPSANIRENENSYFIELAVPGINKDNLKIDLEKNV
ncbi:MAG: Hsp20/alpha crystallin family protein, partial [Bacteroidota bacterium]